MTAVTISLPGTPFQNLAAVNTIAALRLRASIGLTQGENIQVNGGDAFADGGGGLFTWDAASVLDDDGANVIKPGDRLGSAAGRWRIAIGAGGGGGGGGGATVATLDELKAADTGVNPVNLTASGLEGTFFFRPGDFSELANDYTIVASDTTPISEGAWVRNTPIVSVKDFGAAGDGVTDDTPAIQLAIDSSPDNVTIYLPAGLYKLNSQILINERTNLTFTGQGARIKGGATRFASYLKLTGCSRITFDALTFDQLKSSTVAYSSSDYASGVLYCPIEIRTSSRVSVRFCCFDDLYTSAVFAVGSSDIVVTDNIFTSPVQTQTQWMQHIHLQTCAGIDISRNRFLNAAITNPATGVCSVFASGITKHVLVDSNYSEYAGRDNTGTHRLGDLDIYGDAQTLRVTNNVSQNCMAQWMRISSTYGAVISGNRVTASTNAEFDYSMLSAEAVITFGGVKGSYDTIIANNLFQDPGARHAFCVGAIAYDWGVPILNFNVLSNTFEGARKSVLVRGPQYGTRILNNTMRSGGAVASGAILIDQQTGATSVLGTQSGSSFRNILIEGNNLLDESGGGAPAVTINLALTPTYTGAAENIIVQNNALRSSSPNAGQGIVINLPMSVASCHARVEGNTVVNYAIGIYLRSALSFAVLHNKMVSCATPILDDGVANTFRRGNIYNDGMISGFGTLSGGGLVVSCIEVRAGDRIALWRQSRGAGAVGELSIATISDGGSFTVQSENPADNSTFSWELLR